MFEWFQFEQIKKVRSLSIGLFFWRAALVFICLIAAGFNARQSFADNIPPPAAERQLHNPSCPAVAAVLPVTLKYVIDGDTVRLEGGRKVRVIAINAPELGWNGRPAQPLAQSARVAVVDFFKESTEISMLPGRESRDRYGRVLSHLFRSDGFSLAEHMLAKGLAMQIVVPPNDAMWRCLARVEAEARESRIGLWGLSSYAPKSASQLQLGDAGFQRVEGVVKNVSRSRDSWWLEVGELAVRLRDRDLPNFDNPLPQQWRGKRMVLRGWVIDRGSSKLVSDKHHRPLMMSLRHPLMMEIR